MRVCRVEPEVIGEQAQPLGAGGGVETKLHAGAGVAEPGDGAGQDGVEPHGARGDAEGSGAPRAGGVEAAQDVWS